MLCPQCNHTLNPISLKSDTSDIALDYCTVCGGVWSDHGNINFLRLKDLRPLLSVLPPTPAQTFTSSFLCPKDRSPLQVFKGESVPVNLDVYQCMKCNGFWFPHKNLEDFKKAQELKINYFKAWNIPLHSVYAILLPVMILGVVTAGLIAATRGVQQRQDVQTRAKDIISKPFILHPTPQQAVISFTTEKPSTTKLIYWLRPTDTTEVEISKTDKTTHTVTLNNLELNRTYSYQIIVVTPEKFESQVFTFETTNPY